MRSRLNVHVIALLAGATLLSTGAMASPLSSRMLKRSETVKYNPAKATTVAGAVELYDKLHAAAAKVCSSDGTGFGTFDKQDSYETCVADALGKAVARVRSPVLTTLHVQSRQMKPAPAKQETASVAQR